MHTICLILVGYLFSFIENLLFWRWWACLKFIFCMIWRETRLASVANLIFSGWVKLINHGMSPWALCVNVCCNRECMNVWHDNGGITTSLYYNGMWGVNTEHCWKSISIWVGSCIRVHDFCLHQWLSPVGNMVGNIPYSPRCECVGVYLRSCTQRLFEKLWICSDYHDVCFPGSLNMLNVSLLYKLRCFARYNHE